MWQRIQTLYFALAVGLLASLFFCNACTLPGPDGLEAVRYTALQRPYFLILMIIWGIGSLLALITFRSRILQMRLGTLMGLVAIGAQIWLAVMYFTAPDHVVFHYTAIFPLLIAILSFLGARGAFQDQLLVESAYRIRESRRRARKQQH